MTDPICQTDAYARATEAVVMDMLPDGLVLDRTVFYARGGGQPGDTGRIRWADGDVGVVDTYTRDGFYVHQVDDAAAVPSSGTMVSAEIDWARRYLLMRTHTALHVLSGIVWRDFGAKVTGGNMTPGEARMDFELESMSAEFGREIEAKLNDAIAADRPVGVLFLPRGQALADPDLIRTKVNLIPEGVDPIRVIDIEGIDRQADGGTHVRATGEVGQVSIMKTESKGKAFKRMRIAIL
jgi:misacylated tRNA(Ala) deacylase